MPCQAVSPSSREPGQIVNERVRPGIPRWPISRFLAVARIDRRLVGRQNEESPPERALAKLPGARLNVALGRGLPVARDPVRQFPICPPVSARAVISFCSAWLSSWRTRSRVRPKFSPTSRSVIG